MKNKIKYDGVPYGFPFKINELLMTHSVVHNTTTYSNVPEGSYFIRGFGKGVLTYYLHQGGVWYERERDARWDYEAMLQIPQLSEKEWEILGRVRNKLSPFWRKSFDQWEYRKSIKMIGWRTRLAMFKFLNDKG